MGGKMEIETFECGICMETKEIQLRFRSIDECMLHEYCKKCIARYTESKMMESWRLQIMCPGLECEVLIDPNSCRPLVNPKVFDQWVKRAITSPKESLLVRIKMAFSRRGRSNAAREAAADASFESLADVRGWRRCPLCRYYVERIGPGCNRMRCRCGTRFCYQCGRRVCNIACRSCVI